ncbi:hypothetical protein [Solicola sp. PLA-1-18]|uniref:hypothetical protein n=1 Tax=Solicola sp. PLA-1-18 TaxID=3380532 RepID=UPI003B77BF0E
MDPHPTTTPDEQGLDPAESLALIEAQRARVRDAVEVDGRVIFAAWGVAWLVGYLALHATTRETAAGPSPSGLGFAVFGVLLAAALVTTVVHISRRTAGVRGESSRIGAMLGLGWAVAFVTVFAVMAAVMRSEVADGPMAGVLANTIPCLVVGVLYLGQGAAWQERTQFALGAWICLVTAAAAFVGVPDLYLVMALAGGGGFLVGAAAEQVLRGRRA